MARCICDAATHAYPSAFGFWTCARFTVYAIAARTSCFIALLVRVFWRAKHFFRPSFCVYLPGMKQNRYLLVTTRQRNAPCVQRCQHGDAWGRHLTLSSTPVTRLQVTVATTTNELATVFREFHRRLFGRRLVVGGRDEEREGNPRQGTSWQGSVARARRFRRHTCRLHNTARFHNDVLERLAVILRRKSGRSTVSPVTAHEHP